MKHVTQTSRACQCTPPGTQATVWPTHLAKVLIFGAILQPFGNTTTTTTTIAVFRPFVWDYPIGRYQKRHSPTRTWNHRFQWQVVCLSSFWILGGVGKIIEASAPTIRLDVTLLWPLMPPPPSSPRFYAGCPSCSNPPNLSWLGQAPNILDCIPGGLVHSGIHKIMITMRRERSDRMMKKTEVQFSSR